MKKIISVLYYWFRFSPVKTSQAVFEGKSKRSFDFPSKTPTMSPPLSALTSILLCLFCCFGCKKEVTENTDEWVRFCGACKGDTSGKSSTPIDFAVVENSNEILILSSLRDSLWIIKTDNIGLQPKDISLPIPFARKMQITPQGTYLILANTVESEAEIGNSQPQFIEIDADLNVIGTHLLPSLNSTTYISDFTYTTDGRLFVTGSTTRIDQEKNGWNTAFSGIDKTDIYLAEINTTDWTAHWEQRYGFLYQDYAYTLDKIGNDLLITAAVNRGGPNGEKFSAIRTTIFGSLVQRYNSDAVPGKIQPLDVLVMGDTAYLALYNDAEKYYIQRIVNNVVEITHDFPAGINNTVSSLYADAFGNYLATGSHAQRATLWEITNGIDSLNSYGVLGTTDSEKSEIVKVLPVLYDADYIYALGRQAKSGCDNLMLMKIDNVAK